MDYSNGLLTGRPKKIIKTAAAHPERCCQETRKSEHITPVLRTFRIDFKVLNHSLAKDLNTLQICSLNINLTDRARFMHRHSRHVPMLARPGGPKHNEDYIIFLLYYGLSTTVQEPKPPEDIEQINKQ